MLEDGVDGSEVLGNGNEVFGDGHLDTLQEGVGGKARPFGLGCFRALRDCVIKSHSSVERFFCV